MEYEIRPQKHVSYMPLKETVLSICNEISPFPISLSLKMVLCVSLQLNTLFKMPHRMIDITKFISTEYCVMDPLSLLHQIFNLPFTSLLTVHGVGPVQSHSRKRVSCSFNCKISITEFIKNIWVCC